jgi:NAD(P)-dependent dehydrogenase (short-subunit alcohol dehydrogenase family)
MTVETVATRMGCDGMKSVLVTGCSTGIGRSLALALVERGYRVVGTVRDPSTAGELAQSGVHVVVMDLANAAEVSMGLCRAYDLAEGEIDVVIHNAGVGVYGALEDHGRDALEYQFQQNVFGVHQINQFVIPRMRAKGGGRILIVTSVLGFVALPFRGLYCMSKYALEGMADTLRLELHGSGIHVCLVEPGPIETMFRANALREFLSRIRPEESHHKAEYTSFLQSLGAVKSTKRFSLMPDECVPFFLHGVESLSPKARYRVTKPTVVFSFLKRVLPSHLLDKVLRRG